MCVCFQKLIMCEKSMYNPNNIVIGGALIFLVAYAFFIVRRMYKRRIQVLEQKNIQLEKALKTISLNLNPEPLEEEAFEQEQNVVLEFPFMNGNMNNQMPNMSNEKVEEVEEVEELLNKGLSTIPEVQEEEISLSEQNTDIEKQTPILEEPITEVEEKSVSNDTSESEKDLGISKDDINSMTVAQLKEKLGEIGTPVTKGMKKKELRAILLAL